MKKLLVLLFLLTACAPSVDIPTEIPTSEPTQTPHIVVVTATPEVKTTETAIFTLEATSTYSADQTFRYEPKSGGTCYPTYADYLALQAWTGEWMLFLPDYGEAFAVLISPACAVNEGARLGGVAHFDVPELPAVSRSFTLAFEFDGDMSRTSACFLTRNYDGWSNSWPCELFLKNEAVRQFCGEYQRDKAFGVSGVRPEFFDEDSKPCR